MFFFSLKILICPCYGLNFSLLISHARAQQPELFHIFTYAHNIRSIIATK